MPLPYGGFVVDTPGLKEFGLWRATREELQSAFREFAAIDSRCRFADCSHLSEPECAVLAAVERGDIDQSRYASYAKIVAELE
jgi:ribosome biogenesis GTPase